jgi:hypothetical protein
MNLSSAAEVILGLPEFSLKTIDHPIDGDIWPTGATSRVSLMLLKSVLS